MSAACAVNATAMQGVGMCERSALESWQARIAGYRSQQSRQGTPLWERDPTRYELWVEANDYYQKSLPCLVEKLNPGDRVLEIGPGNGVFTIPLAEAGVGILAIEPSESMRKSLLLNLQERKLKNVDVLAGWLEDSLDYIQQQAPFRMVLASFSLYNVREINRVLQTLLSCCELACVLLGTGIRSSWYQDLIDNFAGEEPISAPQLDLFYPLLLEMGIIADVRMLSVSQNYIYDNEQAMVEDWQARLKTPASQRERLARTLSDLAEYRNGKLGIYRNRPLALVVIEQENQIKSTHQLSS